MRIALYSPGIRGLGHMRRNLLIGQAVAGPPFYATTLMLAEARQACTFAMPPGMDCLALPALEKEPEGRCRPRYLGTTLAELINLRAQVLYAALAAFEPDVLIIDYLPRGRRGELAMALEYLQIRGRTRCILGLRDVLESPVWLHEAHHEEMRDYLDAVWIYGDPRVYDLVVEQKFSAELAAKTRYTGYLDQRRRLPLLEHEESSLLEQLHLPDGPLALCLVGGGADGGPLAEAFAAAELPPGMTGLILTGPYMPADVRARLQSFGAHNPRLRVLDFIAEPAPLLQRADRIVAMGGYNTVSELLCFEKPALLVPRVDTPEQLVRARRLQDRGLVELLLPDQLHPEALGAWLAQDVGSPRVHAQIDFGGLERIPLFLDELLNGASRCMAAASAEGEW